LDNTEYYYGIKKDYCWHKAKRELIDILMQNKNNNQKILNIGTGTGEDLYVLNKYGQVHLVEINKNAFDMLPQEQYYKKTLGDACNLSYPNNFFDTVTSFDIFEHIKKDTQAVSECRRVLKKGSYLIFTVPAFQILFSGFDKWVNHIRRYSKKSLKKALFTIQGSEIDLLEYNFFPAVSRDKITDKTKLIIVLLS